MASAAKKENPKHLKPEEIKYLALEGGGGKGFAYLGALSLLEKYKILPNLTGVAGASAGAITALMIALGMSSAEITQAVASYDFNKFYDSPIPRMMPAPITGRDNDPTQYPPRPKQAPSRSSSLDYLPYKIIGIGVGIELAVEALMIDPLLLAKLYRLIKFFEKLKEPPFTNLAKHWKAYTTHFGQDMGIFNGFAARQHFNNLIANKAAHNNGGRPNHYNNLTFKEFHDIFPRELLVTGSNLATGKTQFFSRFHTPQFPVADAIRISMGLPLIFKPYVIRSHRSGWPPCGTYVDGGLWNNIPLREIGILADFAQSKSAKIPAAGSAPQTARSLAKAGSSGLPRNTLALRLDVEPATPVLTGYELLTKLLTSGLAAGESQVYPELEYMTILLDTRCLSLLKFKPDLDTSCLVGKRSRRTVANYFGWPIDSTDVDTQDDINGNALRKISPCQDKIPNITKLMDCSQLKKGCSKSKKTTGAAVSGPAG